ncbi:MAG: hypothetical protein A2015_15140 [Spirochaetes bacterium GWF1_31_7]|nr:MAG: hypothetical protein A2Y30_11565 [Spirochaetes bacterium GWE1_32_154]OHD51158.1 MAG: hypothetical protein A2Y29_01105 [Spirochaetes bacterium GWE2_31_10]OHD52077.1 MAG: hypothetical protein A2015_15140 [Spirochaetes bacterium GWF1_31_7]OHD80847.1 MAG: hypothetical protein A2355_14975 [Spirochaetes bacterium RIFOXYB1_FULL_32_8]HBD93251.1 hypothetical protein [Spirochaetia bacterium]
MKKKHKKVTTEKISKQSIQIEISIVVLLSTVFLLGIISFGIHYIQIRQFTKVTDTLIESKIDDLNFLVNAEINKEVIDQCINRFRFGKSGFCGIVTNNRSSDIIQNTVVNNQITDKMYEYSNTMATTGKKIVSFSYLDYNVMIKNFEASDFLASDIQWESGFIAYRPDEVFEKIIVFSFVFFIVSSLAGLFVIYFIFKGLLRRLVLKPLKGFIDKSLNVSYGDLTINFAVNTTNEFHTLGVAFSETITTLKVLIKKVYITLMVITRNLRTLYTSSSAVEESAHLQVEKVEKTVKSVENQNKMVERIANESDKANKYAAIALEKANVGMESMINLKDEMTKIEKSSMEISEIINMINDIAEQTNLLSLNASIESARAGDAGRGFNIVAGEIRKLAEKSTQAADRIHSLITNNNNIIKVGVDYTNKTTTVLKEISQSNQIITGLVNNISDEVKNVRNGTTEILNSVMYISEKAHQNLEQSEHVGSAIDDFVIQTIELQKFVGKFDTRSQKIKDNQKQIEAVLDAKLNEIQSVFKNYGKNFLLSDDVIRIELFKLKELWIGKTLITGNNDFADEISKIATCSFTIFQLSDNNLIRVATTVKNFDNSRAVGSYIDESTDVFQKIVNGQTYFGRVFVVNRWYVAVYSPIIDSTNKILGAIYLGLPEENEFLE